MNAIINGRHAIGFDIDGTITEDNGAENIWDREILEYFNIRRLNNSYDFCKAFSLTEEQVQEFCRARIIDIYHKVPVKPGVTDTIKSLRDSGVKVHLITARSNEHAHVTKAYLDRNGIGHDGLWFEKDKVGLCRELGIGFFVDDNADNCLRLRNAGINCIMVDAFHNSELEYSPRVTGWNEISALAWKHLQEKGFTPVPAWYR